MTGDGKTPRLGALRAAAVFATALLVRASIVMTMAADDPFFDNVRADSVLYLERAAAIAGGTLMAGRVFEQGPLYPYLIAPLLLAAPGEPIIAIALVQAAADATTALLLAMLGARSLGSPSAGLAAGLGYALLREPVFYASKVLPSSLLLLATVASLLALSFRTARARSAAGFLMGLACLLWPGQLPALPLLALWLVAAEHAGRHALAFAAGATLAIAPATLHNLAYEGRPVLISSHGGIAFYQGNNPRARGTYTSEGAGSDIRTQADGALALARRLSGAGPDSVMSESDASRVLASAARRWIAGHPRDAAVLLGRKLLLLWSGRELPLMYSIALEGRRFVPGLMRLPAGFTLLSILLPAACILLRREDLRALGPPMATAGAVAATQLLVFVTTRYKLPLLPLGCLVAAAGARRIAEAPGRRLALAALLLLPGLVLERVDRHNVPIPLALYVHLSDIRLREGDLAGSLLEVELARELRPDHPASVERAARLRAEAAAAPLPALLVPVAELDPDPSGLAASAALVAARGDRALARRLARTALAVGGRSAVTRRLAEEALR